jgi:hypothetical protein
MRTFSGQMPRPKGGTLVVCEPTQLKCKWTCKSCNKSHFKREVAGKMPRPMIARKSQDRDAQFVRACAVKMHMDMSEEPFDARIYRRNATGQSKCTWTPHKFTRAMLCQNLPEKHRHPELTPALPPTVRTPQSGHTVWEKWMKETSS